MRSRMAIRHCKIQVELREVILSNKPAALIEVSPKATVPVLICNDGNIIDQSLDIMHWALAQADVDNWLDTAYLQSSDKLIRYNDNIFKIHLDHYKYADRFPEHTQTHYREKGEDFLLQLECLLQKHNYLLSDQITIADIAIFPFIRQFAFVDIEWFKQAPYPRLNQWLFYWLNSELFSSVMHKYPAWEENQQPVLF